MSASAITPAVITLPNVLLRATSSGSISLREASGAPFQDLTLVTVLRNNFLNIPVTIKITIDPAEAGDKEMIK